MTGLPAARATIKMPIYVYTHTYSGNVGCALKDIEMFVATSHQDYSESRHPHEFWIRVNDKNHYHVLPVPPGKGMHVTWTIPIAAFKPEIKDKCFKYDDIEEMFLKERGSDGWIIHAISIHYIDWCEKKRLGPDYHHFNKLLDGDSAPSKTILELIT